MRTINLFRVDSSDEGTFGAIPISGTVIRTVELPWRDNARGVSCIPEGSYICAITNSPHFGKVFKVFAVEGRSDILLHWGNWGGDESKGLKTDTDGCIILGLNVGVIDGQKAVLESKVAFERFMKITDGSPFILKISKAEV